MVYLTLGAALCLRAAFGRDRDGTSRLPWSPFIPGHPILGFRYDFGNAYWYVAVTAMFGATATLEQLSVSAKGVPRSDGTPHSRPRPGLTCQACR